MPSNLAKAAVGALALNGEGGGNSPNDNAPKKVPGTLMSENGEVPPLGGCPGFKMAKFHEEDVCLTKPSRPPSGDEQRGPTHQRLKDSGTGASLVPNQHTVVCPLQVNNLASSTAVKGFDTTWIVENTSTSNVVVSWVVDGIEWSPFEPNVKPMDDPKAILKPGEWTSVPTFESFVYHVREIDENGASGNILLQHRVGLIPLGNPNQVDCDPTAPDIEPVDPETAETKPEVARTKTHEFRRCNTMDIGFRNQAGCPLHVYWANGQRELPGEGFTCGEKFKFHVGTKPATQDFMHDWESTTKFEGTFVGHMFVARLASNPNVIVDSHVVDSTKIIDCPNLKKQVPVASDAKAEALMTAEGTIQPLQEENVADDVAAAAAMAGSVRGSVAR